MKQVTFGRARPANHNGTPNRDHNGHVNAGERRAVMDVGPSLFGEIPSSRGTRRLAAPVLYLPPGPVDMTRITAPCKGWIGLMIVDGLLLAELDAGRARTGWLVGADDLVCPWDMVEIFLNQAAAWRALTAVRLALLDHDFAMRAGGIPIVTRALVRRAARTANWLLAKNLVLAAPLVEERLLLMFALLGERWGTVNHQGVLLKIPLTHSVLATLCGVRRPSVTIALRTLRTANILAATADGGWLLHRVPSGELTPPFTCWDQYVETLGFETSPQSASQIHP